jgi:UPF0716 family protein affecting phage T7 exclusion
MRWWFFGWLVLEVVLAAQLVGSIGVLGLFASWLLAAVLGVMLLRRLGMAQLGSWMKTGMASMDLGSRMLRVLAAVLLILPGLGSDALALLLLLPGSGQRLTRWLNRSGLAAAVRHRAGHRAAASGPVPEPGAAGGQVYDGEWVEDKAPAAAPTQMPKSLGTAAPAPGPRSPLER